MLWTMRRSSCCRGCHRTRLRPGAVEVILYFRVELNDERSSSREQFRTDVDAYIPYTRGLWLKRSGCMLRIDSKTKGPVARQRENQMRY